MSFFLSFLFPSTKSENKRVNRSCLKGDGWYKFDVERGQKKGARR
jgi:hypothetical protein